MVLAGVVGAVLLTGCGPSNPGPTGTAQPTSSRAGSGAPPLAQPELDTGRFKGSPCGLLTAGQSAQVASGVVGEVWPESILGPSCQWDAGSKPGGLYFSVTINTKSGGLDGIYEMRSGARVFESTQVGAYPAVVTMPEDLRDRGQCVLETAVAKAVTIRVDLTLNGGTHKPADYATPCPRAVKISELVLETLKGGG
ncbi:DUF3558 domain-containing protein [Crossiella sp. CA198]|uniref:DUF3558 domain-containing protein n=1 Tax=Crossiella sp. CA198 TaxID=3455607 RepID=UPI003F8D1452